MLRLIFEKSSKLFIRILADSQIQTCFWHCRGMAWLPLQKRVKNGKNERENTKNNFLRAETSQWRLLRDNPVLDPLAVLHLDNRLYIILVNTIVQKLIYIRNKLLLFSLQFNTKPSSLSVTRLINISSFELSKI